MFSVNNALQKRDFLTRIAMKRILKQLKAERPKEDHGSERDGAYTTHAMHQALQKHGKQLVFMNKRFKCKSDKLIKKVFFSS
ncbi:hypothetical protein KRP22_014038 [Phytophthora ramorum]|nr:hypothetical protein KRP22_13866 [Phytophthora ramorum]